jgi:hypothetical protein
VSRAAEDDEDDDLDDEEGELVEHGVLRVDPKVAAEKLSQFQLSDPEDFLVPWLRAAVASRARRVSAGVVDGALTFQFDGDDPGPDALADLTAGFLSGDGGPVARNLAFGALALQRLEPDAVHAAREDGLTVLRVRWARRGPGPKALRRLWAAYGMTRTALTIDGQPVPDPAQAGERVKSWKGARMSGTVLEDRGAGDGRARLYVLGALVETVPVNLGGHYTAYVSNERFSLSLSQSAVVKDARYEKAMRRLVRMRRKLRHRAWSDPAEIRSPWRLAAFAGGAAAITWLGFWAAARVLLPY